MSRLARLSSVSQGANSKSKQSIEGWDSDEIQGAFRAAVRSKSSGNDGLPADRGLKGGDLRSLPNGYGDWPTLTILPSFYVPVPEIDKLMSADMDGDNPSGDFDGLISSSELADVTNLSPEQAKAVVAAYGEDGLLNVAQIHDILDDEVTLFEFDLSQLPPGRLAVAMLTFDTDGDGRLNEAELIEASGSFANSGMLSEDQARKVVAAFASDGEALDLADLKALAGASVLGTAEGAFYYSEYAVASYLLDESIESGVNPFDGDCFRYINEIALPGKGGTVGQLAFTQALEEYKNAPEGSQERKFYDLMVAKSLTVNGLPTPELEHDLSGSDFSDNVFKVGEIDKQIEDLFKDKEFASAWKANIAKKTNEIIDNHFVVVDGRITLKDENNPAHANAPLVDGGTWAKAALDYARSDQGRQEYQGGTPDEQKAFVEKHFGDLAFLLPEEEVNSALGELVVKTTVHEVLQTDLQTLSDEDLATVLEQAGSWLMGVRGPTNLVGHLSNVTKDDWILLAQTLKKMVGQGGSAANFKNVIDAINATVAWPDSAKRLGNLVRALGQSGMWGTFAGVAGVTGAIMKYMFDDAARERLRAGDPREILALMQNLSLVLSYSGSITKAPLALLGAFGVESAQKLFEEIKSLPGFGRLAGSMSAKYRPTFKAVAEALAGVNLTNIDAVKAALSQVDEATKAKWAADYGYDFKTLASNIVDWARQNPYSAGGGTIKLFETLNYEERLGFLFEMMGIDKNYKHFVQAQQILSAADAGAITDEASLRRILRDGGMSQEAIDSVVGELSLVKNNELIFDTATSDGSGIFYEARDPSSIRSQVYDMVDHVDFVVPNDPTQKIGESIIDQYKNSTEDLGETAKLAPDLNGVKKYGVFIKGLGAVFDVIGGAVGVALGIYDIVQGAKEDDNLGIAGGAFGIASGAVGAAAGAAGLGFFATALATPLFAIAGLLGLVSVILTLVKGSPEDQAAENLLEPFEPYGIVQDDAHDFLSTHFLHGKYDPEENNPIFGGS